MKNPNSFFLYLWIGMKPIKTRDQKLITIWLFIGMTMVFIQILLGGITRLTGSGLSITRWDIVTGVIPPLGAVQWQKIFELYKESPQYQHINFGMSLAEFKFIFFWEYIHRLWARSMGFIFVIPFLFFLFRKSLSRAVLKRLSVVIMLAGLAAIFGWIMVASGLKDRPWVSAYKLTIHLCLGILLFLNLFFTWLSQRGYGQLSPGRNWRKVIFGLFMMTCVQVFFGGLVSGMKSALNYPTWPLMNDAWIPSIILDRSHWNADNFLLYDKSGFMSALVQFIHRNLAYLLAVFTVIFAVKWSAPNSGRWHWVTPALLGIIFVQISLGILTLVGSIGSIPVLYGALHQGVGIIFLTFLFYLLLVTRSINII